MGFIIHHFLVAISLQFHLLWAEQLWVSQKLSSCYWLTLNGSSSRRGWNGCITYFINLIWNVLLKLELLNGSVSVNAQGEITNWNNKVREIRLKLTQKATSKELSCGPITYCGKDWEWGRSFLFPLFPTLSTLTIVAFYPLQTCKCKHFQVNTEWQSFLFQNK